MEQIAKKKKQKHIYNSIVQNIVLKHRFLKWAVRSFSEAFYAGGVGGEWV